MVPTSSRSDGTGTSAVGISSRAKCLKQVPASLVVDGNQQKLDDLPNNTESDGVGRLTQRSNHRQLIKRLELSLTPFIDTVSEGERGTDAKPIWTYETRIGKRLRMHHSHQHKKNAVDASNQEHVCRNKREYACPSAIPKTPTMDADRAMKTKAQRSLLDKESAFNTPTDHRPRQLKRTPSSAKALNDT